MHEVAEQLEHIQSQKLVDKLEEYLEFPAFDPHGDPIPNANGEIVPTVKEVLANLKAGDIAFVASIRDTSNVFLQYLEKLGINIGTKIQVMEKVDFHGSMAIIINEQEPRSVSVKFAQSLYVRK